MKTNALRMIQCVVICTVFLQILPPVRSQVPKPSAWGNFVLSGSNPIVRDTFRLQTFAKQPADNWAYSSKGDISIVETSTTDINGKSGKYALKVPMGTEVAFQHYPLTPYENIVIKIHAGGKYRKKGDSLMIRSYRPAYPEYTTIIRCNVDGEKCPFGTTLISRNPPGIDLVTFKSATNLSDSFYCIDSLYAYGDIPSYTLFSGHGNWNDTIRWSHLPAARHRNALVNGNISIDSDIHCGHLLIGDGGVRILPASRLSVDNLTLYATDHISAPSNNSPFLSSGTVEIQGSVFVEKEFAQKGTWYFISFPFDIYPEGIDPRFQLGDGQVNASGNYFYLKTYNGERRANQGSITGNWETVPRTVINSGEPLFRKGKGYLIALDDAADRQTLRFTSRRHDIPADFGKNGTSPILATINSSSGKNDHDGWYLCGNPLPSALPLSEIEPNENLDGFVYVYDGSVYRGYAIGSDHALPPFSAFFVKATQDTELSIRDISLNTKTQALSAGYPLSSQPPEPDRFSVSNNLPTPLPFTFHADGKEVHIGNMTASGNIHIFDFSGSLVYSSPVSPGNTDIQVPLSRGSYILRVQTDQNQATHKFIIP